MKIFLIAVETLTVALLSTYFSSRTQRLSGPFQDAFIIIEKRFIREKRQFSNAIILIFHTNLIELMEFLY